MFKSILFKNDSDKMQAQKAAMPEFFTDLNIDQIVDTLTSKKHEYDLKPFFYTKLEDVDAIKYRQEIMKDLENEQLSEKIRNFEDKMRTMRGYLGQSDKLSYKYQKERWFLDGVELYCDAVLTLTNDISCIEIKSEGFISFREYLNNYVNSDTFRSLDTWTKQLEDDLSKIKYALFIKGNTIKVKKYESEKNYSQEIEEIFEKFKQDSVKDYRVKFSELPDMNHVEAKILDFIAALYPEIFSDLDEFYAQNSNYGDKIIITFDREIQFYLSYVEFMSQFKRNGLSFCYPEISDGSKEFYAYQTFDLALGIKLINDEKPIVCNDFYLKGRERIFVITGPNQGGKTTSARTIGQLHYFANIGCPVAGKSAKISIFDKMLTYFEREESINDLRGKLEDDLFRINKLLNMATPKSLMIINEIFSSTTFKDALFLSEKVMEQIFDLDLLCVWVTFIDEIASMNEKVVSMASTVVPDNPAVRTYKVIRKPAEGLSYAISIAEKYHLTYNMLKERVKS